MGRKFTHGSLFSGVGGFLLLVNELGRINAITSIISERIEKEHRFHIRKDWIKSAAIKIYHELEGVGVIKKSTE